MNEVSLLETLGQVSASETGQVFRDFLRGHVREMICQIMAAEVTELCGAKHAPAITTGLAAAQAAFCTKANGRKWFARVFA